MISPELLEAIVEQYPLPLDSIHGIAHWARVLFNTQLLAHDTGADLFVCELFSVFHDARRENEGVDFIHGREGAELARQWRGKYFELPDKLFDLLYVACAEHTTGTDHPDATVRTCWDADRLDLGRVGIMPDPARLCTEVARDAGLIAQCYQRSREDYFPQVFGSWKSH